MSKPRVTTRCVANGYAGPHERIVEFGAGDQGTGGLISFRVDDAGRLQISIYQVSGPVDVLPVSRREGEGA